VNGKFHVNVDLDDPQDLIRAIYLLRDHLNGATDNTMLIELVVLPRSEPSRTELLRIAEDAQAEARTQYGIAEQNVKLYQEATDRAVQLSSELEGARSELAALKASAGTEPADEVSGNSREERDTVRESAVAGQSSPAPATASTSSRPGSPALPPPTGERKADELPKPRGHTPKQRKQSGEAAVARREKADAAIERLAGMPAAGEDGDGVTPAVFREALGVTDRQWQRLRRDVAADPRVLVTGTKRTTRYFLSPEEITRRKRIAHQTRERAEGSPGKGAKRLPPKSQEQQEPTIEGRILGFCSLPRSLNEIEVEMRIDCQPERTRAIVERLVASGDMRKSNDGNFQAVL
jgi:hypothetical protein